MTHGKKEVIRTIRHMSDKNIIALMERQENGAMRLTKVSSKHFSEDPIYNEPLAKVGLNN